MIKKFFLKSSVFALLFSSIISINDASAKTLNQMDGLQKNMMHKKNITHHHNGVHSYENHHHHKKHHHKKHRHKQNNKLANHYDHKKVFHQPCNKYGKYFAGFGFGVGFSSGSDKNISFNGIDQGLFSPAVDENFLPFEYDAKFDHSFNPSLSFGYWAQNHLAVGVDFDYFSLRDKQKGLDDSAEKGYMGNQIASVSAVAQFFLNANGRISPYLQIGIGAGRAMLKGAAVNTVLLEEGAGIDDTLYFDSLNKNVGLVKLGLGFSKEYKSSTIGVGYQFMKTTKIDDADSGVNVKFRNSNLIDQSNFGFTDLARENHSINLFVKSTF